MSIDSNNTSFSLKNGCRVKFWVQNSLGTFIFLLAIKLLFEIAEHHVHDDEYFDQEKIQQVQKFNLIE